MPSKQLERLYEVTQDSAIKKQIKELLPEWRNNENRIRNKLELAQLELSQMEDKEVSLVESFSKSSVTSSAFAACIWYWPC